MSDKDALTQVVLAARCQRCNGNGFKLVQAENRDGEKITGASDKISCEECEGYGIKLGICRRLASKLNGHTLYS